jgi:hypothetical protein
LLVDRNHFAFEVISFDGLNLGNCLRRRLVRAFVARCKHPGSEARHNRQNAVESLHFAFFSEFPRYNAFA